MMMSSKPESTAACSADLSLLSVELGLTPDSNKDLSPSMFLAVVYSINFAAPWSSFRALAPLAPLATK